MTALRGLWIPVLVALLVAALIGPGMIAGAEPKVMVTKSVIIPASAFSPYNDNVDYQNTFYLESFSPAGYFHAPLWFPVPVVNIKRITLYVYDTNSAGYACVQLRRSRPAAPDTDTLGQVCSTDDTPGHQTVYTTAISPRQVNTEAAAAYLFIHLSPTNVHVRGVKVTYTYEG